ncbi:MAG: zinc-dependent metalloprotease family protein [Acidobacteriota bacterium]
MLALSWLAETSDAATTVALFASHPVATPATPTLASGPEVVRWRAVQPTTSLAGSDGTLAIDLFDRTVVARHQRTILNPSGSRSWIGTLPAVRPGEADGLVVLVQRDDITIGSIRHDGALFMLLYSGLRSEGLQSEGLQSKGLGEETGVHVLLEIDERAPRFRHEEPTPARIDGAHDAKGTTKASPPPRGTPQDDGSIQDLMVVYTPLALDDLGGSVTATETLIELGVTETNLSYETSGIDHRLRLVHTALTDFDELEPTGIDARDHLQDPDDGFMDEIHPLRDLYRADLVKLLTSRGCGRAFIMDVISAAHEEFAFCRTSVVCVSPGYTFAHELGHVASGRHQRPFAVDGSPLPYNFGYIDAANRFRTIMAAGESECPSGCPRRLAWSNPDVLDPTTGAPMGVPEGDPEAADNRKAMNFTASVVANFRVSEQPFFGDGFESGDLSAWSPP